MDERISHGLIFENTLFSLLIAVVVGWTVVSVAGAASSPAATPSCTVSTFAAGINRS
jgi:hypothetical protein